jgi:TRAP-type mannitol/chloroaromatic compound transport system permease large subunit
MMLNRLPLIDILFRVGNRLLRRTAAAPYLTGIGLGALMAPMNGSVGASVAMLARAVLPRLNAQGVPAERSAALVCTASTIGVVVPPSLVLILLGDAMMRAHTEAVNATARATRIINTQDIFHGALLPAACLLLLFFMITWWRNRKAIAVNTVTRTEDSNTLPVSRSDWIIACCSVVCILALLTSVTLGYLYAVEGAATGGLVLLLFGLITRSLTRPVFEAILRDTLAITGMLFALLIAATMYTLVLRAFETDLWISDFLRGLHGGGSTALIIVLLILMLSAFVLDAIEITFVIIPIAMPPLLMLVPDTTWVAVLTLMVLQASFLLPPFGYAVLMAGSIMHQKLSQRALARALLPYLLAQVAVMLLVLLWPNMVWHSHSSDLSNATSNKQLSDEEVHKLFDEQRLQNEKDSN